MRRWRGAHAWCVRVERVLHACARVPAAARASSRRRASRQASLLSARHASRRRDNSDASELAGAITRMHPSSQCVLIQGSFLQRTSRAFCTVCAPRHSPAAPPPCCAAAAGRRGAANRPPRDRCQPRNNSAESGSNSKSNCGIGAIALHPLDLLRHGAQSIIGIRKSQEAQ